MNRRFVTAALPAILLLGALVYLTGCSSAGISAADRPLRSSEEERFDRLKHRLITRHFLEGSTLQMSHRYADAIEHYQRAIRLNTEQSAPFYAIAKCYSELGETDSALLYAHHAVIRSPDRIDAREQLADLLVETGAFDEASAEFLEILRRDSFHLRANYMIGNIWRSRAPRRAIERFEFIRTYLDAGSDVLFNLAELYQETGNHRQAIGALEELVDDEPTNPFFYSMLADFYLKAGDHAGAADVIARVNRHIASRADRISFLEAQLAEIRHRIDQGRDSVEGFRCYALDLANQVERYPESWRVQFDAGLIYMTLGHSVTADSNIARALRHERSPKSAWLSAATGYFSRSLYERGLNVLMPRADEFGHDSFALYLLGFANAQLGRDTIALSYLQRSVRESPGNSAAWGRLALIHAAQGNLAAQDSAYEMALTFDPGNPVYLNNYAYSLAERDLRLPTALRMAQTALDASPENTSYLDTVGWILFKQGKYGEALRHVQRAVDLGETGAEVLEHLGDIYMTIGDHTAAFAAYECALRTNPDDHTLRLKIERVCIEDYQ